MMAMNTVVPFEVEVAAPDDTMEMAYQMTTLSVGNYGCSGVIVGR
jgi:hypothetical protein